MTANPFRGVFLHWLGGLAAGSFSAPFRFVRRWSWETHWLVGGVFSWMVAPRLVGLAGTNDLLGTLSEALATQGANCFWTYFFGVLWGVGGLTFGLTMRYLGLSLGMAVALGYCAAFGTLVPPIFRGTFASEVVGKPSGLIILVGVAACLLGIAVAGMAGMSKERELSDAAKRESIQEFSFKKGIRVATFSGHDECLFRVRSRGRRPDQGPGDRARDHDLVSRRRFDYPDPTSENLPLETGNRQAHREFGHNNLC